MFRTFESIISGVTPKLSVEENIDIVFLSSSGIDFGSMPVKS